MDFFSYKDQYHQAKDIPGSLEWLSAMSGHNAKDKYVFYRLQNQLILEDSSIPEDDKTLRIQLLQAEDDWFKWNTPYVKVYPAMADYLGRTKIDIPSEWFKLAYSSVVIRLANDKSNHYYDGVGRQLQTVMVHQFSCFIIVVCQFTPKTDDPGQARVITTAIRLELIPGETIEQMLNKVWDDVINRPEVESYPSVKEIMRAVLAMAISTHCFLIGNHELVAPDIMRKIVHKYHEAKKVGDKSMMLELTNKSKRNGLGGWKLGEEIKLPRDLVVHHNKPAGTGTSELSWGHVRSGHLRLQPIGNRDNPAHKLIFIMPMIVRPDLPMKPLSIGYRIEAGSLPSR